MGSNPAKGTVAVAEMVMHRIVNPNYMGSNPIGHITNLGSCEYRRGSFLQRAHAVPKSSLGRYMRAAPMAEGSFPRSFLKQGVIDLLYGETIYLYSRTKS